MPLTVLSSSSLCWGGQLSFLTLLYASPPFCFLRKSLKVYLIQKRQNTSAGALISTYVTLFSIGNSSPQIILEQCASTSFHKQNWRKLLQLTHSHLFKMAHLGVFLAGKLQLFCETLLYKNGNISARLHTLSFLPLTQVYYSESYEHLHSYQNEQLQGQDDSANLPAACCYSTHTFLDVSWIIFIF